MIVYDTNVRKLYALVKTKLYFCTLTWTHIYSIFFGVQLEELNVLYPTPMKRSMHTVLYSCMLAHDIVCVMTLYSDTAHTIQG